MFDQQSGHLRRFVAGRHVQRPGGSDSVGQHLGADRVGVEAGVQQRLGRTRTAVAGRLVQRLEREDLNVHAVEQPQHGVGVVAFDGRGKPPRQRLRIKAASAFA